MQDALKHKNTFRADVARGIRDGKGGIDKKTGIIYGFAVITKGEARGHGLEIDETTLDQAVELGAKSSIGLKSRFGHPNMSNSAVGTFLGRAKNFRKEIGVVRADLYFDKTAYNTPNGDLAGYVLDLAESDPDAFGSSIVFDGEPEYRLNEDGTRKKDPATGKDLLPLARITKLWAVDVVDDPAANNGMFGAFFSETVKPSAEMTVFLDKFLSNPEAVEKTIAFLERYSLTKEEVTKMELKDLTLEILKKERSDLTAGLSGEGLNQERERIISLLDTAKAFPGTEALVYEAAKNGDTSAVLLEKLKQVRLGDLKTKSPASAGPGQDPAQGAAKTHLERAREYQKQFGGTITEALRVTAEKRKQ
ncbi:MAG: hypothetical protein HZC11_06640 [Nitrospirae bacterium]|nr:hypothetical protein [Nitrospirota bacterium]